MIEYLLGNEKIKSRKLYEEVFPEDSKEFLDYYFQDKIKNHKVLVKHLQNNVVGMLHRNPHLLSIRGHQEEIDYIYAVATGKDYRKQGIMKELLIKALKDMHQEGKPFTYLIPVAERIYAPYGFTYVSDNYKTMVKKKSFLKAAWVDTITLVSINDADGDKATKLDELSRFSNKILEKKVDVFSYRTLSYYKDLLSQLKIANGQIELFYRNNKLEGYCYLNKEEEASIWEILCDNKDIDLFLQAVLEKHSLDQISVSGIFTDTDEDSEEHELHLEKKPFIMARILNIKKFFAYITSKEEKEVVIEIVDPIIEENNGVFLWKSNQFGSTLQASNEMPAYRFEISDLTGWVFGNMFVNEEV